MENKSLYEQATIWKSRWDNRFIIRFAEDHKVATLDIQKNVRELSEKLQTGCGVDIYRNGNPKNYATAKCGDKSDHWTDMSVDGIILCHDCIKAREICEEILK